MARKRRAAQWSMKDDRDLIELAAANLDDLAAHFNRPPASVVKRGRRLGVYLRAGTASESDAPPENTTYSNKKIEELTDRS